MKILKQPSVESPIDPARPYRGTCPSCQTTVECFGVECEWDWWPFQNWWKWVFVRCPTNTDGYRCHERIPMHQVEVAK